MNRALLLVGSSNRGAYARPNLLSKISNLSLDILWIDKKLAIEFSTGRLLVQNNRRYDLLSYNPIIYWPPSFQNPRNRIGSGFSQDEYVSRSWRVVEEAMFFDLDHLLLNPYHAAYTAANKAIVHFACLKNKIPIPLTTITNSIGTSSASTRNGRVVKTVTDTVDIDQDLQLYTTNYLPEKKSDEPLSDNPFVFQEFIKAVCEYRVYFFRGDIIIARIERKDGLADVRLVQGTVMKCRIVNNREISDVTFRLAGIFNLVMFSADFVEDKDGRIYFLDLNPHGSWTWLETSVRRKVDQGYVDLVRELLPTTRTTIAHRDR